MKTVRNILALILLTATLVASTAFLMLPPAGQPTVLMYHFIADKERAVSESNVVSRESFAHQMAFLKNFGYRVITLQEFSDARTGKRRPGAREVLLTFDDGNYTVATEAMPVLKKYGFPVTLFVISENIKTVSHGSMSEATLKELMQTGLVTLGSHTRTHPLLTQTPPEQLKDEVEGSKRDLEAMFGVPMTAFAYPGGEVNAEAVEAVRAAGYEMAFSTSPKRLHGLPVGPFTLLRDRISRPDDLLPVFWSKVSGINLAYRLWRASRKKVSPPPAGY